MKLEVKILSVDEIIADAVIVPVFEATSISISGLDEIVQTYINSLVAEGTNCYEHGQTTFIHTLGFLKSKQLLLLGLGKKAAVTPDKTRQAMAIAMRAIQKLKMRNVSILLDDFLTETAQASALVEGAVLGEYRFLYYKNDKKTVDIEALWLVTENENSFAALTAVAKQAEMIAGGVNLARDLANHPAQYMTPTQMAWQAEEMAKQSGMEVSVLRGEEIRAAGMQAFAAVAQGSDEPATFIVLKYQGDVDNQEFIAFVGKGITFDSGGISIKPSDKMGDMKGDMAGGGAVLGAMSVIGQLKPKVNIWGIIPCAENMPSGHAYRPGDIISSLSGKTIEIINTDAEGRLILADAITYACTHGATKVIDLATLTGACVIALGNVASGVITNNQDWYASIAQAASRTGEKIWQMPNFTEYKEQIKSDVADLKNTGGRMAGMVTAGLFLGEFADNTPWVHVDIAGTADTEKVQGYNGKGATGAGVRLLVQLAQDLARA